jgi:5'-nucleotidase
VTDIRFVYFDLDDTLLDHRGAERRALIDTCGVYPEMLERHDADTIHRIYAGVNGPLWRRYAAREIDREDVQRLRFEGLLLQLGMDGAAAGEVGRCYLEHYSRHWTIAPEALEAFHRIADAFRVGIITNGFSEVQHAKMARFPEVSERIEVLVVSEDVGIMKPDPRIFEFAAEEAGVEPGDLLYVGDSLHSDVEAALEAGWQAAWFHPPSPDAPPEAFRFEEWSDLLDRLTARNSAGRS